MQLGFIAKIEHPQQLFERRPHPFDAAVHPLLSRFDPLMLDAEPAHDECEDPGSEDRLVVGSDLLGLAVMLDGIQQQTQERDR